MTEAFFPVDLLDAKDFSAELLCGKARPEQITKKKYTKWIDYDKIDGSLVIRSPQAEDFFYFNDKNRKFVKDYMVNEKIPKTDREKQLLLADGSHMVYFLGRRISNYYKVTEDTRHILEITVTGG